MQLNLKKLSKTSYGLRLKNIARIAICYSGNTLSFKIPDNSKTIAHKDGFDQLYNIYNEKLYYFGNRNYDKPPLHVTPYVSSFDSFNLYWSFYKRKLLKHDVMDLELNIVIRKIPRLSNLFLAKQFERAVVETIDVKYGPYSRLGEHGRSYEVPLNWHYQHINSLDWISYNIQELKVRGNIHTHWCTPLSHEHFLCFEFDESDNSEKSVSRTTVNDFIAPIISSCEINFTAEVQQQRELALRQNNHSHFCESRKPRFWIIYEDDPEQFLTDFRRDSLQTERKFITCNLARMQNKYIGLYKPSTDEKFDTCREQALQLRKGLGLQQDQDPDEWFDLQAR